MQLRIGSFMRVVPSDTFCDGGILVRSRVLSELVHNSSFSRAELLRIAEEYTGLLGVRWEAAATRSKCGCADGACVGSTQASLMLNKQMFSRLLKRYLPVIAGPQMLDTVFSVMDINADGKVDFREFCLGVSKLMRGSFSDKLEFAFSLLDPAGAVAVVQLCLVLAAAT